MSDYVNDFLRYQKTHDLYVISSVFHLLIAAAVAASRSEYQALFVFVRFDQSRFERILPCLKLLSVRESQILFLKETTGSVKERKINAKHLLTFAESHHAETVFVGNDRHVEFQYLAAFLKPIRPSLKCVYLDEGLYSYIGRKASTLFAERFIDQALKRMAYGNWFFSPSTIGASKYVDEAWLAYPNQACSFLQTKECRQLPLLGFEAPMFKAFIECWGALYDLSSDLSQIDFILTITDEKNFVKFPNYRHSITELVHLLVAQGKRVAVKYHPNANHKDLLDLGSMSNQIMVLPSSVPFEVLLPLLPQSILIAEFSSTLITSRLLNPKMQVWSLMHTLQAVPESLVRLFDTLGIQQYSQLDLTRKIKAL